MKEILEIYCDKSNTFIPVEVTLTKIKGFKKLFDQAKTKEIEVSGQKSYSPYWFEGLDMDEKDWVFGGHYEYNLGLINLSLSKTNVQGVVLNGNKCYLLKSVRAI